MAEYRTAKLRSKSLGRICKVVLSAQSRGVSSAASMCGRRVCARPKERRLGGLVSELRYTILLI
jgi:hypothetical protein